VHREFADVGVGGKNIIFDLIAFEMRVDVVFDFFVIGAGQRARAKFHNFLCILHRALAVNGRHRAAVRRKRQFRRVDGGRSGSRLIFLLGYAFVAGTSHQKESECQQHPRQGLRASHYACFSFAWRLARCFG
jgi:hypothetical protein